MAIWKIMLIAITGVCLGCQTATPYLDAGVGYLRFDTDDIVSHTTIQSKDVETKLTHADAFLLKVRTGASFIECLPQMRGGLEFRGGIGGAYKTKRVEDADEKAYSDLFLILVGGGPFISWKQPLGKQFFVETGGFVGGYTIGVQESGIKHHGHHHEDDQQGVFGWSGGLFGKIGIQNFSATTSSLALECAYEMGQWDFDGDLSKIDVKILSFLFSTEIQF